MGKLEFNEKLPLDLIDISLSNVRKSNLEEGLDDLAKSIKEIGLQQPIMVYQKPDRRFALIIGQRRYLACKKLGLKEIPALITTVGDEVDATVKSFSENIHRLDLDYRDKMQVATELLKKFGTIDSVAEHLGVVPQTVKNWLGYAAVPDSIKKRVEEGKLSASTAIRIVKNIPDEKKAAEIAELIDETPRSELRRIIVDVAHEHPDKSKKELAKIAKERANMIKITIHVTRRVYEAIILASEKYQSDKEDVVKEAVLEWLKKRGFVE